MDIDIDTSTRACNFTTPPCRKTANSKVVGGCLQHLGALQPVGSVKTLQVARL